MRGIHGWAGLRAAVLALGIGSWAATAGAAPLPGDSIRSFMNYSTSGQIGSAGVDGDPVISFTSATNASYTASSFFSLGEFQMAPLPTGQTTTYTNTPFSITYIAQKVDGETADPNGTPVTLTGVLNGTLSGATQSNVIATFDQPTDVLTDPSADGALAFRTGSVWNNLKVLSRTLQLVPSTTNGGRTTAQAQNIVTAAPVPEPASVLIFLSAVAGLAFRHRVRGRALKAVA